jgi:dipeptidyl aminopeptidase/acylaminoacyl peptidase
MLTHIWLARAGGSGRRQFTFGEKSATAPAFSPDGRWLCFASDRSGKKNVYRIPVSGGEAEMLTDWKGSLENYRISPDGKWIAFTGAEPDANEESAGREKRDFRIAGASPRNRALWVIYVEPDATGKRAPRKLAGGDTHIGNIDWAPDSRRIAFERRPSPEADLASRCDIDEVELESGQIRSLAATGAAETQPRYSPDGRYLVFARGSDPPSALEGQRIVLRTRESGEQRLLPASFDESPQIAGWAADSRQVLFVEALRTRQVLYSMPIDGPPRPAYAPLKGTISPVQLNSGGTHAGFVEQSPGAAPEAAVLDLSTKSAVQVSRANATLQLPPAGATSVMSWKARDGLEIEGLLTLPDGYEKGRRYPLVLVIHGGPAGVFAESFTGAASPYPVASFASKGYAVLRANIRGSSAYGRQFRSRNVRDWGGRDYQDLMDGVDHVIAQGVADPDRMAVMGWSYGGYMTAWVITQTRRFKAAAVGAGITNLVSMWGTNDIPSVLDDYFGGPHWAESQGYLGRSAMYHVKNAATPTLILHGEKDDRVPPSQGYELRNALKRRGVPVEMVIYPRTPHGPQEPKFVLDIMKRHLGWVERFLPRVAGGN